MPNLFDTDPIQILVAEDNPTDVELLKMAMSLCEWEIPFQLHVCQDGQKLLDFLIFNPETEIDIAILDINMPRLNGIETLQMIRKHPKWHRLPVILFSSNDSPHYVKECHAAGANDFFAKPHNPKGYINLVEKIKTILSDEENRKKKENSLAL